MEQNESMFKLASYHITECINIGCVFNRRAKRDNRTLYYCCLHLNNCGIHKSVPFPFYDTEKYRRMKEEDKTKHNTFYDKPKNADNNFEVVGNIYDNKELLDKEI